MRRAETDMIVICAVEETPARAIVYFDGGCPLCTAEINHYRSQDGADHLCFVDAAQADAELGTDLNAHAAKRRLHVRLPDGTLVSGARAFAAIWQALPGWRWAARIAQMPGAAAILELGYRLFLPVRPLLSKGAARLGAKPMPRHRSDC
ncbi:MAG: DUF393 domain-containing protein [Gammaproteobacteria bacterium]|jgi:predicted DCC family thiol-disulfide oxidoreductase YuxK|nr:DUF393 domain-containing protein [Gammaproteobacteria bacterium]